MGKMLSRDVRSPLLEERVTMAVRCNFWGFKTNAGGCGDKVA